MDYVKNSYGRFNSGDVIVDVEVCPSDVIAVPIDYNNKKMRVCKYLVLGKNDEGTEYVQSNYTSMGYSFCDQYVHLIATAADTVSNKSIYIPLDKFELELPDEYTIDIVADAISKKFTSTHMEVDGLLVNLYDDEVNTLEAFVEDYLGIDLEKGAVVTVDRSSFYDSEGYELDSDDACYEDEDEDDYYSEEDDDVWESEDINTFDDEVEDIVNDVEQEDSDNIFKDFLNRGIEPYPEPKPIKLKAPASAEGRRRRFLERFKFWS